MNSHEFADWAEKNSLAKKLMAALENIEVGKGWSPFNGLEKGEVLVKVVYDGINANFQPNYTGIPGFDEQTIFQSEATPKTELKTENIETPNETPEALKEGEPEPEKVPDILVKMDELAKRLHEGEITEAQYKEILARIREEEIAETPAEPEKKESEQKKKPSKRKG